MGYAAWCIAWKWFRTRIWSILEFTTFQADDQYLLFIIIYYNILLVGGFNLPEKYESQLGLFFPIYGKVTFMFQTTNCSISELVALAPIMRKWSLRPKGWRTWFCSGSFHFEPIELNKPGKMFFSCCRGKIMQKSSKSKLCDGVGISSRISTIFGGDI